VNLSNPRIEGANSLQKLIDDIDNQHAQRCEVFGTIEVPDWRGVNNHFQGIAPVNGLWEISGQMSASADDWWAASFVADGDHADVKAVWGTGSYDHAGGIQRLGDLLPIGLENDAGAATVALYNVSNPAAPQYMYEIHVSSKASAVAITDYHSGGDHYALLLVYHYSPKKFTIYRAAVERIENDPQSWEHMGETNDLPDQDDDDQYQCFALATQRNGTVDSVYLLGFRENEALVLYTVNTVATTTSPFGQLGFVAAYRGWEGSEWRYGVGLQIVGPQFIRIFGCSEDPSGDRDDYKFPIYYWG